MDLTEIARGVFFAQLGAMQHLLQGCIEGKEPLFLHDLRVANRRTRVALIIFKDLLPEKIFLQYQLDFQWVHQITGGVRDLDIGLSYFPFYVKQVPKSWRSHLEPLKSLMEEKRKTAQGELARVLGSEKMSGIINSWTNLLQSGILEGNSISQEPAREYGCQRIVKRFKQLRKRGLKLSKNTAAEKYHEFRINVKELRYLMEFFHPVMDHEELEKLKIDLKSVQDAFGDFQDTEVQLINLRLFTQELHQEGVSLDTLLALGQLLGVFEKKLSRSKKNCLKQARRITTDSTARAFQSCFQYPVE
ncbi:MAG: CHAD domain-containing protein [Anaerolineales bacterium]|nr:CHAD domain-containing protein [Anaerolineales bacterium]